jgi:hypothetical protein
MTIIQPKVMLRGMNPISSVEMPLEEFRLRNVEYATAAYAAKQPDAPLVPGETQCKYCRAKGSCSALANKVMEDIGVMFNSIEVAQQTASKDPNEMTDDQVREIIESIPLLRQLIASIEEEALTRMKSGKHINGLKMVRGRGSRGWSIDDEEVVDKLRKMGVPKASTTVVKTVSPAQAEKLTWAKRNGETKQLSKRQLKTLDTEYIKKSEGKLTVVSESDDRQSVVTDASPMFGEVNQQPVADVPAWLQ